MQFLLLYEIVGRIKIRRARRTRRTPNAKLRCDVMSHNSFSYLVNYNNLSVVVFFHIHQALGINENG